MTKIERALVELALCSRRVTEINKLIGEALSASRVAAEKTWETTASGIPVEPSEWFGSAKNGWLVLAYQIEREHYGSGVFDTHYANHDGDVEGYLAEKCQHALRAHMLIQERKGLRKALGIAKRRVAFMANRLADKAQKGGAA